MKKILIPVFVVLGVIVYNALFVVQEINQAIVLQFGDPKKIITKPGLNYKIPFIQNVVYLDRRVLNLDNPPEEVIAADQKRLIVDAFARLSTNGDAGSPLAGYYTQASGKLRSSKKVAITEFLNDPLGADTDSGREYVELFNYGTEDVSIQNWSLKDEDHDILGCCDWLVITTDAVTIPAGGYLLFASLKDTIEAEYFSGVADDRIIEYGGPSSATMQISNSTDEFVLLDAAGDTVWNFTYINDDAYDGSTDDGFSTYLDYATDFSTVTTDWGHKNQGIVRNGPDTLVAGSPLGYEGGAFTVDTYLIQSTNGDMGSPLAGGYVALALDVDVEETLPTKFALNQN